MPAAGGTTTARPGSAAAASITARSTREPAFSANIMPPNAIDALIAYGDPSGSGTVDYAKLVSARAILVAWYFHYRTRR